MRFIPSGELVRAAGKDGYAIPALNTNGGTYDIARAALEAAQELRAPLILQVYEPNCEYRGYDYFVHLAEFLCRDLAITVPVALQLDHGHSYESVMRAMGAGFSGVMFDASHEPLQENMEQTRQVVRAARALGVSVEAEVGYVKGNETPVESQVGRVPILERPTIPPAKTDPEEAMKFCEAVDVDMLAVSVGTTHGVYRAQDAIDFELLRELAGKVPVPLVQHGTCGISLENVACLVAHGMRKVNFGEPFRFDYISHFTNLVDSMEHRWHAWRIMREVKDRLKDRMKDIIRALGADSRAG